MNSLYDIEGDSAHPGRELYLRRIPQYTGDEEKDVQSSTIERNSTTIRSVDVLHFAEEERCFKNNPEIPIL